MADIQLIGGIRLGLSGPGSEKESYVLKELNFSQNFYSQSSATLAQKPLISMILTKVSVFHRLISLIELVQT